jgi:hypothetical protein
MSQSIALLDTMFDVLLSLVLLIMVAQLIRIDMLIAQAIDKIAEANLKLDKVLLNASNGPSLTTEQEAVINSTADKADKLLALFPDAPVTPPTA